ncbi:MAG: hypothetical protein GXZ06_06890 [Tissierellia bacterium]|nr:hypothetical protein [Tissierellia bacterium]
MVICQRLKKFTSYVLLLTILMGMIVSDLGLVYAAANEPKVTVTTIYTKDTSFNPTEKRLLIADEDIRNLEDKVIIISEQYEGLITLSNIRQVGNRVEADLQPQWIIKEAYVEGYSYDGDGNRRKVTKEYLEIGEAGIPVISNAESYAVSAGEPIVLNLSSGNPRVFLDEEYTITVNGVVAEVEVIEDKNQIRLKEPEGRSFGTGSVRIEITKRENKNGYILEAISLYLDVVYITGKLNIEGVTMFPTMGEAGSRVSFTRSTFPSNEYDIYFIKDLNNPDFTVNNMVKNLTINVPSAGDTVITGTVPDLDIGPYYVVFTNANSQKVGVQNMYLLPQQYQIVSISQKPIIDSVYPNRAPGGVPTKVTINGQYFVNHNVPGFTPEAEPEVVRVEEGATEVTINYGKGTLRLEDGEIYDVKVIRKIVVEIGRPLKFEKDGFTYSGDERDLNTFIVRTEAFEPTENQIEDVVIRVRTIINEIEAGEIGEEKFQAIMEQEAVLRNAFTFYPSSVKPLVDEVIPQIVPVENINNRYFIHSSIERLLLTFKGSNFLVTRYEENGEEKINYPIVSLGGTVINPNDKEIDPNEYKPVKFEVLRNGKVVDGTTNNEIGDTIAIVLEAGEAGFEVRNKESRILSIRNPRRESDTHRVEERFTDLVRFEEININDFPVIDSLRPSMVPIDGGVEVTITGSNLRPGARVYVDNKLATNIRVSGDMKEITFIAPRGDRAGDTLLHVINPEGGIATHIFTYTETYTQPELDYINPKEGTTNTLVTVKGKNFLPQDPTVVVNNIEEIDQSLIYRLIGTRVLIEGHDINEYNLGSQNRIELAEYKKGEIFKYSSAERRIVLGQGYDSVVFYDENTSKFYTLVRDVKNNYSLESGEGIKYEISYENGKFFANGHEITTNNNGVLAFNGITLKAYTPYKMDKDGNIIGHRTKFIDSNTLIFKLPNLNIFPWTGEGYYDISIINPDTKTRTIRDGFYFYASSYTIPKIVDLVPDKGPDVGGNIIHIYGPEPDPKNEDDHRIGFVDTGTLKTKVFIGGQQVPEGDVNILPGGRIMEVKVPRTLENIKEKGTDRITVPLVVVNPDGGSFSISYHEPLLVGDKIIRGYTYVVPTSNPRINSLIPQRGSAGGGYILEIFGYDFRDFEPYVDLNGNNRYDEGEPFDDIDGSGDYTYRAPETKAPSKYNPNYEYLTSPLIPKVYFGNKLAEVVEFASGYLQVIVPPMEQGLVDVYVVNNDSGISNKVRFRYEASNPSIESIIPGTGDFRGGTKISIYGKNLENNIATLIRDKDGELIREVVNMPLIRFGNNTNENLPRDDENSGVIRSNRARVKLEGNIEVEYNALNGLLTANIEDNSIRYTFNYEGYTGEEIFINTRDFKNNDQAYPYEMLIRIVVENNRLIVSAHFAPEAKYYNLNQVTATTPYYYQIGRTPVFIINPDKGQGQGHFEYKYPDSDPKIVNITKDGGEEPVLEQREEINGEAKVLRLDYKGGNRVTVHGTDFREGAIIRIENVLTIRNIEYNLPTELTFTMPQVPEHVTNRLMKLVVENPDGGTADSSENIPPIFIEFIKGESSPQIHTISPQVGPVTGGTKVTITGNDFRSLMEKYPKGELKVYFGDVRAEEVNYIDYKTLEVIAPASKEIGQVQIRVENPDGSISRENIRFTYISKPRILSIWPNRIFTNDTETEVTITGQMFMPGAKVVVGGRVIAISNVTEDMEVKGEGIIGVDGEGNNRQVAVVGGMEAAEVRVEGENVIKVRFNEVTDLENYDIIILNPDGGISDPYDDFQYEIPLPDRPIGLEGIPGYESTVKLIWHRSDENILNRATRYEIYGKLARDDTYTFIGDTTEAEFLVKDLEPNTLYNFRVRALNEYGSSLGYATVRVRTLSVREDTKLKDKEDKLDREEEKIIREGKEEFKEDSVRILLGENTLRSGLVSLTQTKYNKINKFTLSLPIEFVRTSRQLTIIEETLILELNLRDLYTQDVSRNDKGNKDAYVNIHIEKITEHHIPRGKLMASKAYEIYFSYQFGKETIEINRLLNPATATLIQDTTTYPHDKNTRLYIFNRTKGQYEVHRSNSAQISTSTRLILLADR